MKRREARQILAPGVSPGVAIVIGRQAPQGRKGAQNVLFQPALVGAFRAENLPGDEAGRRALDLSFASLG